MIVYYFQVVFKWMYNFVNFHLFLVVFSFFVIAYSYAMLGCTIHLQRQLFTSISIYTFKV